MVSDSWGAAPLEERVGGFLEGASGNEEREKWGREDTALDLSGAPTFLSPSPPTTPALRQFHGTKLPLSSIPGKTGNWGVLWVKQASTQLLEIGKGEGKGHCDRHQVVTGRLHLSGNSPQKSLLEAGPEGSSPGT